MNLFLVSNFLPARSNNMMKIDRELIMHIMSVDNFSNHSHSEDSIKHGLSSTQQTKSLIIIILLTHSNMPSKLLNGPVNAEPCFHISLYDYLQAMSRFILHYTRL